MSNTFFRHAAAWMLAALSLPALAEPDDRPYLALQVGLAQVRDWPARVDFGSGVAVDGRVTAGRRAEAGLLLGRRVGPVDLQLEWQAGAQRVRRVELGLQAEDAGGPARYQALTVNAARRFALGGEWSGFVAGGVGLGRLSLPGVAMSSVGCHCFAPAARTSAVVQLRAGAQWQWDPDQAPFVQLTLLRLPSVRSGSDASPQVAYPARVAASLAVGWRRAF